MRNSTVEKTWCQNTNQVTYLIRVDGIKGGLFFHEDELHQLAKNIQEAL